MMGYLGDEYYAAGDLDKAESWYRESIASMPSVLDERDQRSAATFTYLLQIMEENGNDIDEMKLIYGKAAGLLPKEADFDYLIGTYLAADRDYAEGVLYLERALDKLQRYGSNNRAMLIGSHLRETYENLALCCRKTGKDERAVSLCIAVLKSAPYSMEALYLLLEAFRGNGFRPSVAPEKAMGILEQLYCLDSMKDRLFVLKACSKLGWPELEAYIKRRFTAEELSYIRSAWPGAISAGPEEINS